ncbi:MAG: MarR family transcriptional regulator [Pseudomonadota bacterium]
MTESVGRIELARTVDAFMRRLHAGIHAEAIERDKERVGPIGGMVLMAIEEFQPTPIHQLVEHLGRDKSQMTRIIQQLEGKALIRRAPSEQDGRSSVVALTPKGACVVRDLQSIVGEVLNDLLEPLQANERAELLRLLKKTRS